MKVKRVQGEKPYAVVTDLGGVIQNFYSSHEAHAYMDYIKKYPAVADKVDEPVGDQKEVLNGNHA